MHDSQQRQSRPRHVSVDGTSLQQWRQRGTHSSCTKDESAAFSQTEAVSVLPGQWPPEQRFEPTGTLHQIREAILAELRAIQFPGGSRGLLAALMAGQVASCPFPQSATERIRRLCQQSTPELPALEHELPQPIDIKLLQRLRKLAGDPDVEVMDTYRVGVPLGVGVDLPRTPHVFLAKEVWSLKE